MDLTRFHRHGRDPRFTAVGKVRARWILAQAGYARSGRQRRHRRTRVGRRRAFATPCQQGNSTQEIAFFKKAISIECRVHFVQTGEFNWRVKDETPNSNVKASNQMIWMAAIWKFGCRLSVFWSHTDGNLGRQLTSIDDDFTRRTGCSKADDHRMHPMMHPIKLTTPDLACLELHRPATPSQSQTYQSRRWPEAVELTERSATLFSQSGRFGGIKPLCPLPFPARHQPRCPDSAPCSPLWRGQVKVAQRADSWCAGR